MGKKLNHALDALERMARQHCLVNDDGETTSGGIAANAIALQELEDHGRFLIDRILAFYMVVGRWADKNSSHQADCASGSVVQSDGESDAVREEHHQWDESGERCLKCGDKDWFAGPHCTTAIRGHACRPKDREMIASAAGQELLKCAIQSMVDDKDKPHEANQTRSNAEVVPQAPAAAEGEDLAKMLD